MNIAPWAALCAGALVVALVALASFSVGRPTVRRGRSAWARRGWLAWGAGLVAAGSVTVGTLPPHQGPAVVLLAGPGFWVLQTALVLVSVVQFHGVVDLLARRRHNRRIDLARVDRSFAPRVALHVTIDHEEPSTVLVRLESLLAQDYPSLEVVVVAHSHSDLRQWSEVASWCSRQGGVQFYAPVDWPGGRAGALNFALTRTSPSVEVVGVVPLDFVLAPDLLSWAAPLFAHDEVAFVKVDPLQPPYAASVDLSLRARGTTSHATLGREPVLIRRQALVNAGGWDESNAAPESELALRLVQDGGLGLHLPGEFAGRVVVPRIDDYRRERLVAGAGAVHTLKRHARVLLPWRRSEGDLMTPGQRWAQLTVVAERFADLTGLLLTLALVFATLDLVGDGAVRPSLTSLVVVAGATSFLAFVRTLVFLGSHPSTSLGTSMNAGRVWLATGTAGARGVLGAVVRPRRSVYAGTEPRIGFGVESLLALTCFATATVATTVGGAGAVTAAVLLAWQGCAYLVTPVSYLVERAEVASPLPRPARQGIVWAPYGLAAALTGLLLAGLTAAPAQSEPPAYVVRGTTYEDRSGERPVVLGAVASLSRAAAGATSLLDGTRGAGQRPDVPRSSRGARGASEGSTARTRPEGSPLAGSSRGDAGEPRVAVRADQHTKNATKKAAKKAAKKAKRAAKKAKKSRR